MEPAAIARVATPPTLPRKLRRVSGEDSDWSTGSLASFPLECLDFPALPFFFSFEAELVFMRFPS